MLLIFDRLIGTYVAKRDDIKPRCGWVQPIVSNNPLRIAFQQWIYIFHDLRLAKSVRDVAGYLFGPPGWQPHGNGMTTENLRKRSTHLSENKSDEAATLPQLVI